MTRERQVGDEAPEIDLERVGGGRFDLCSARGRPVLVSFHRYAT